MRYLCTICSKKKRLEAELMPARLRYLSSRISLLIEQSQISGIPLLILSGRYGLLSPDEQIPWYDHLLLEDEVMTLVPNYPHAPAC